MSDDRKIYHKSKNDDIAHFLDNDLYLPTRTIYMGSADSIDGEETGVDYNMAERVIKTLHILDNQDAGSRKGDKPITIIMNNPGGDVYHGMAIYDAIQNCKNQVRVHVYGHAMSMGAIILQAADVRKMSANSKVMIHYGEDGFAGHASNMGKWSQEGDELSRWFEDLLLGLMGGRKVTQREYFTLIRNLRKLDRLNAAQKRKNVVLDIDHIEEMLKFDTIFTAEQALRLNLIDGILNDDTVYEEYEESEE